MLSIYFFIQGTAVVSTTAAATNTLHSICLIITAIPLVPAYTEREQEGPFEGLFVTRHSGDCTYSMVEESAIPFTGYLPQVMCQMLSGSQSS